MSETGFKCPSCGNEERFTAYEMVVTGRVDVRPDGYQPEYGHGVHEEMPSTATMVCQECGEKRFAIDFMNACADSWWPDCAVDGASGESLTNDLRFTVWSFDGSVYVFEAPTRDEVAAFHKVSRYHAIENVLSELSHRRERGKIIEMPTMDDVERAADMLMEMEDNDGDWHLLLEEAVDHMLERSAR